MTHGHKCGICPWCSTKDLIYSILQDYVLQGSNIFLNKCLEDQLLLEGLLVKPNQRNFPLILENLHMGKLGKINVFSYHQFRQNQGITPLVSIMMSLWNQMA